MNGLDAVEKVMKEAGEPISYVEIAKRTLEQGLWQTEGKTPEAAVNARLAADIKKHGTKSRFQRTDNRTGLYGHETRPAMLKIDRDK